MKQPTGFSSTLCILALVITPSISAAPAARFSLCPKTSELFDLESIRSLVTTPCTSDAPVVKFSTRHEKSDVFDLKSAVTGAGLPGTTIDIRFDEILGASQQVASGFMFMSLETPNSCIEPLMPQLWRMTFLEWDDYVRIVDFGARYQYVVSEGWGYPSDGFGWPYEKAFEQDPYYWWDWYCKDKAEVAKAAGMDVEWDIWNEPDLDHFWKGSRDQWFTTYSVAFNAIRSVLPKAVIGGPSLANYSTVCPWEETLAFLTEFLDYCVLERIEANFLSWHENNDIDVMDIDDHINDVRALAGAMKYDPVKVQKIYVNETIGPGGQYSPGHAVVTIAALERGNVDGVARACWCRWPKACQLAGECNNVDPSCNNCTNGSLNGLLDPCTYEPHSVWWAYAFYGAMCGSRVQSFSSDPAQAAFATRDTDRAIALIGYSGPVAQAAGQGNLRTTVNMSGLTKTGSWRADAKVFRISNTNEDPLLLPETIVDREVLFEDGEVRLIIPIFLQNDAYFVQLDNFRRPIPTTSNWGLIILLLLLLTSGTIVLAWRERPSAI